MLPDRNLINLVNLINKVKIYHYRDEANTKSNIITPILQSLNWNVNSLFEVVREYRTESGTVDYALKIVDDIKVLIEAKKMNENLDKCEDQLRKYAINNINLYILSNGKRWQFYTWLKKGIGIHNFYNLDFNIHDANFIADELYNILSKESIISGISNNYIKNIIAKDQSKYSLYAAISEVWHNILEEPSPLLCNLIIVEVNKAFNISAQRDDVEKILNDYNVEFKKIRGTLRSPTIYNDRQKSPTTEKLKKNLLRLKELLNSDTIPRRKLAQRIYRYVSKEEMEEGLAQLCAIGFCELVGRKIKIPNHNA